MASPIDFPDEEYVNDDDGDARAVAADVDEHVDTDDMVVEPTSAASAASAAVPLWTPLPGAKVCEWPGCERGSKPFGAPSMFRRHYEARHLNPRPPPLATVCEWPGCIRGKKPFCDPQSLRRHVAAFHSKEPSTPTTPLAFMRASADTLWTPPPGATVCEWPGCTRDGRPFNESGNLQKHVAAVHLKLCPYPCTHVDDDGTRCTKTFSSDGNRQKHIQEVHTDERRFACTWVSISVAVVDGRCCLRFSAPCLSSFDRECRLRSHIVAVHSSKPYVCDWTRSDGHAICGERFSSNRERDVHVANKHGDGKHVCMWVPLTIDIAGGKCRARIGPPCGKRVKYMKMHIDNSHLEQRNFVCTWPDEHGMPCGKSFSQSGNLHTHVLTVHKQQDQRPCIGGQDEAGCLSGGRNFNPDLRYGKRCVRCFIATFPNDPRAIEGRKWLNAKELTVREFLESTFRGRRWVFDRGFSVGVKQRPDSKLVVDKHTVIIVEVDEHSHDTYDCIDERGREELFAKHAPRGSTIALIRINPDAYDCLVTGKRIPSCFRFSKQKLCVSVDPAREADWQMRLGVLKDWVQHFIDYPPQLHDDTDGDVRFKHVLPIELFYDDVAVKWPNGKNPERVAQHKAAGKKRALAAEAAAASSLADGYVYDSSDEV
jgi:hypothetical protein